MLVTIKEMAEKLLSYDEYMIIYHIRPDGDCIGSSFALALALQSIGKHCAVTGRDPVPHIHQLMTDKVKQDVLTFPVYISVDAVSPQRTGSALSTSGIRDTAVCIIVSVQSVISSALSFRA